MKIISINGEELPLPLEKGYDVSISDLDSENSNRGEDGFLFRERIRAGVYKISYRTLVNTDKLAQILALVAGDKFSATFYFGEYITKDMYAGDKAITLVSCDPNNGNDHWEVSFNLIEF